MTETTQTEASALYRFATSDLTKRVATWALTALVAGISAAFGFGMTWQNLRAEVSTLRADVVDAREEARKGHTEQTTSIKALEARQHADDVLHGREAEIHAQILQQLKDIREDVQYLQRDLIGRVRQGQ